ncbi:hypothetical protein Hanom_Chr00s000955g01670731 [Helianthus anomalus]
MRGECLLNSVELDESVSALIVSAAFSRSPRRLYGVYFACDRGVKVKWDDRYASSHGKDVESDFNAAQEAYNKLSLPVMDLVSEALKHDDFVARLKDIFELPEGHEVEDEGVEEGDDPAP